MPIVHFNSVFDMRLALCLVLLSTSAAVAQPALGPDGAAPSWRVQVDVGAGPDAAVVASAGLSRRVWRDLSVGAMAYRSVDVFPCDDCSYAPATAGEIRGSWVPRSRILAPRAFVAAGVLRGRLEAQHQPDEWVGGALGPAATRPYALAGAGLDLLLTRRVALGAAIQGGVADGLEVTRTSVGVRVGV